MEHVITLSRRIDLAVRGLLWLVPLGWAGLMVAAALSGEVHLPDGPRPMSDFALTTHLVIAALATLHVGVFWLILRRLRRLLALYRTGTVFVPEAAAHYRAAGYLLIVFVAVDTLGSSAIAPVLWTLEGVRGMPFTGQFNLPVLLIGFAVILLSRIMHLASVMNEEHSLTI